VEEILELKQRLLSGDFQGSIAIVEDLEEMGKKGIIRTIRSYAIVLLLHLIKQQAEGRSTRSGEVSIRNSTREIQRENKRRKAKGYYLNEEELQEVLAQAYLNAIDSAALEVEEGRYSVEELDDRIDKTAILDRAFTLICMEENG